MKESEYTAGLWIKENINSGSLISNSNELGARVFAISGVSLFTGADAVDLAYGYFNISKLEVQKRSITEENYWFAGPYIMTGGESPRSYYMDILSSNYESYKIRYRSKPKFNFTHVIEDKKIQGLFKVIGYTAPSNFLNYVYERNCIYDNGVIRVWNL